MTGRTLAGQAAQALAWDAQGELTSVKQDGNGDGDTADANEMDKYLYSADGERLVRTQDGASTLYLPGGAELTAYADGRASTANRYYSFGGKTITMRAAIGATGQTTVIPDHHGTPMLQVNQSTNRVTRQYTDPYGATRGAVVGDADADGRLDGTSPAWVGDHGYLDQPEDTSGLTAVGARMYDPVLGRFISVDPIMDLTDPQQWNAYAYASNNPTSKTDPTGLREYASDGRHDSQKQIRSAVRHSYPTPKAKPVAAPPWSPPTPTWYSPLAPTGASRTSAPRAVVAASESETNANVSATVSGAGAGEVKREKLRLQMTEKSGNFSVKVKDPAWHKVANNNVVSGISKVGSNPIVKRSGVAGTIIGTSASWIKYGHENGGDPKLATVQAGLDLGAGLGGAWAGAQAGAWAGAAIGALFGGVGAAPGAVIGAAIGGAIGAFGATKISGWGNDRISARSRRSIGG